MRSWGVHEAGTLRATSRTEGRRGLAPSPHAVDEHQPRLVKEVHDGSVLVEHVVDVLPRVGRVGGERCDGSVERGLMDPRPVEGAIRPEEVTEVPVGR